MFQQFNKQHNQSECALGNNLERREHRRFDLQVQIQFNWKDRKGVRHLGWGRTRDISAKGMFVCSDSLPPRDTEVRIELFFPSSQLIEAGVQMTSKASVLRLEPATPCKTDGGFAVVSQSFALRRRKSTRVAVS